MVIASKCPVFLVSDTTHIALHELWRSMVKQFVFSSSIFIGP